jgi:hypothetical protein
VAVVSLATAVLSAASTARPLAAGRDELPPALLKLAPEVDAGGVRLRVEVVDPSGPGTVRVHVRAPGALDDTAIPMERVAGGTYEARVPRPDVEEPWIVYWFEATDAAGNGPARNGSAASPFVERFGAADPADSPRVAGLNLTLLLAPVVLLLVLLLVYRRRDRGRELEFWIELLGPVSGLGGRELGQALERLCERGHYHPIRGEVRVDVAGARRMLARLARTHAAELERERERVAAPRAAPAVAAPHGDRNRLDEDLFWFHVLSPLMDLTGPTLESELRALSTRSLPHPRLGRHYFDVPALRAQLGAVRRIDAEELLARAAASPDTTASAPPPPDEARGASLIELLVMLAILGLVLGAAFVSLMPVAGPVERAGEQIDGVLRQARARAMASMTVHRVRPLDADTLIVETASDCASAAWSLDARFGLELAGGVVLSDTSWSACFDGRGLSSESVTMTLLHTERPPRQLELLRGGMVRWI